MEKELLSEIKKARRKAISLADKRNAKQISDSLGGKQGRDLAIPVLVLLLILVVWGAIFLTKSVTDNEVVYNVYPTTEIIKETVTKNSIIDRHIVVPNGSLETCIQLNNETFRRCYDE